ncbi:MAG: hypothetical protein ACSLEN_10845 [Candidatus Malihini olakiniferum]
MLVIIHDLNLVRCHFSEIIAVNGGLMARGKTPTVLDTLTAALSTDALSSVLKEVLE